MTIKHLRKSFFKSVGQEEANEYHFLPGQDFRLAPPICLLVAQFLAEDYRDRLLADYANDHLGVCIAIFFLLQSRADHGGGSHLGRPGLGLSFSIPH